MLLAQSRDVLGTVLAGIAGAVPESSVPALAELLHAFVFRLHGQTRLWLGELLAQVRQIALVSRSPRTARLPVATTRCGWQDSLPSGCSRVRPSSAQRPLTSVAHARSRRSARPATSFRPYRAASRTPMPRRRPSRRSTRRTRSRRVYCTCTSFCVVSCRIRTRVCVDQRKGSDSPDPSLSRFVGGG